MDIAGILTWACGIGSGICILAALIINGTTKLSGGDSQGGVGEGRMLNFIYAACLFGAAAIVAGTIAWNYA